MLLPRKGSGRKLGKAASDPPGLDNRILFDQLAANVLRIVEYGPKSCGNMPAVPTRFQGESDNQFYRHTNILAGTEGGSGRTKRAYRGLRQRRHIT